MTSNPQSLKSTSRLNTTGLTVGQLKIQQVSGGQYRIDGGTLFGVVPRLLWEEYFPADKNHRILQQTNCLLIKAGKQIILVDTGYGSKLKERFRKHHDITEVDPLLTNLATAGLQPEQIDCVILSHLHFDHAGGCTSYDENQNVIPTFPNAEYVIQQQEWEVAMADFPELKGAYNKEDFEVLSKTGQLRLVDNEEEICDGIHLRQTGGHTQGHQIVILQSENEGAVYAGDLCATKAHQRLAWCMSYDTDLLQTRREKQKLLKEAQQKKWWLFLDHDPNQFAIKVGNAGV